VAADGWGMALDGFLSLDWSVIGSMAEGPPRRRWNRVGRKRFAAMRRPPAPSRRIASVRMAPATFLWLTAGWAAALVVLAAAVLVLRSLA
jgi:hypothetical protein